jgi:hypothetical protein
MYAWRGYKQQSRHGFPSYSGFEAVRVTGSAALLAIR